MSVRPKTYYLHPLDHAPTNEAIVREIIGAQNVEENKREEVMCADGRRRDMYICTYDEVKKATGAIPDLLLKLQVYWGYEDSRPQLWRLWEPQVRRRNRERKSRLARSRKNISKTATI